MPGATSKRKKSFDSKEKKQVISKNNDIQQVPESKLETLSASANAIMLDSNDVLRLMKKGRCFSFLEQTSDGAVTKKPARFFLQQNTEGSSNLCWRSGGQDNNFPFDRITDVYIGKQTKNFQSPVGKQLPLKACFSLVSKTQTVDIQADSHEILLLWLFGINTVLRQGKKRIVMGDGSKSEVVLQHRFCGTAADLYSDGIEEHQDMIKAHEDEVLIKQDDVQSQVETNHGSLASSLPKIESREEMTMEDRELSLEHERQLPQISPITRHHENVIFTPSPHPFFPDRKEISPTHISVSMTHSPSTNILSPSRNLVFKLSPAPKSVNRKALGEISTPQMGSLMSSRTPLYQPSPSQSKKRSPRAMHEQFKPSLACVGSSADKTSEGLFDWGDDKDTDRACDPEAASTLLRAWTAQSTSSSESGVRVKSLAEVIETGAKCVATSTICSEDAPSHPLKDTENQSTVVDESSDYQSRPVETGLSTLAIASPSQSHDQDQMTDDVVSEPVPQDAQATPLSKVVGQDVQTSPMKIEMRSVEIETSVGHDVQTSPMKVEMRSVEIETSFFLGVDSETQTSPKSMTGRNIQTSPLLTRNFETQTSHAVTKYVETGTETVSTTSSSSQTSPFASRTLSWSTCAVHTIQPSEFASVDVQTISEGSSAALPKSAQAKTLLPFSPFSYTSLANQQRSPTDTSKLETSNSSRKRKLQYSVGSAATAGPMTPISGIKADTHSSAAVCFQERASKEIKDLSDKLSQAKYELDNEKLEKAQLSDTISQLQTELKATHKQMKAETLTSEQNKASLTLIESKLDRAMAEREMAKSQALRATSERDAALSELKTIKQNQIEQVEKLEASSRALGEKDALIQQLQTLLTKATARIAEETMQIRDVKSDKRVSSLSSDDKENQSPVDDGSARQRDVEHPSPRKRVAGKNFASASLQHPIPLRQRNSTQDVDTSSNEFRRLALKSIALRPRLDRKNAHLRVDHIDNIKARLHKYLTE